MGAKVRTLISTEGPLLSDSAWIDAGETVAFAAFSSTGTATEIYGGIIALPTVGGESPATGAAIQRLLGGYALQTATLSAQATLTLGLAVYRAGVILGGTIAFGWLAAGGGTPALNAKVPVSMPSVASNTALIPAQAGEPAFLPLLPGDVVVLRSLTSSGSVSVGAGAFTTFIT